MKKRMNRVTVCLDDNEYAHLLHLQKITRLSKSKLLRYMLTN